jgi:hypothetical protein
MSARSAPLRRLAKNSAMWAVLKPRRVGRSAYYDDYHLSQLRTINQLHRRGGSSSPRSR